MKTPLTPAQLARRLRLLANDMHDVAIDLQRDETNSLPRDNPSLVHSSALQHASVVVREWADAIEQPAKA